MSLPQQIVRFSKGIILTSILMVFFQNCSQPMNAIDEGMKTKILSSQNLFEQSPVCDGDYCPPGSTPITPAAIGSVPTLVTRICTNRGAQTNIRVMNASELNLRIYDNQARSGTPLCHIKDTQLKYREQIKKGGLDLGECLQQASSSQWLSKTLYVTLESGGQQLLTMDETYLDDYTYATVKVSKNSDGSYTTDKMNPKNPSLNMVVAFNFNSESGPIESPELCDHNASPLAIDLRGIHDEGGAGLNLSSPAQGVLFDILGENAAPVAHTPYRISWFQKRSGVGLLALPNKVGEVKGINQLFGDNTRGPDGRFAANGYLALAKFDDNGDGLITQDDAVFHKLRVWLDHNSDGIATRSELLSLKDLRLSVIDLRYDSTYSEVDSHGNLITYKSVVKFDNGSYRLMFDIWFKINSQLKK
ncbi:MAG: hypothetical protein KF865_10975 [Bdellovibrionaceae bacterium]|nr:hypothetical protein [Pseudobdellovibrionaceae bacterium]